MDTSQFFLDPEFEFDPSLVEFPVDMAQIQTQSGEAIKAGSAQQTKMKSRIRASRACIACRSRHMKCDSVEPVCTRCQLFDKTCVYTKSRRGGSHKAPPAPSPNSGTEPKASPHSNSSRIQTKTPISASRTPSIDSDSISKASWSTPNTSTNISNPNTHTEFSPTFSPLEPRSLKHTPDLLSTYYEFFDNAHPIVLPKRHLQARLHSNPSSLTHLLPVLQYIGSVYHPSTPSTPYLTLAEASLSPPTLPIDAFSVQALTLFALARHCSDEYAIADKYVDKAIDIALALGMNRHEFAEEMGEGDAVLEESWRRTWWLLYTVDALFATISHACTHRLQDVEMDVGLPCEDAEYESGLIPPPHTFTQYDTREFHLDEITFSSLTYLLDSIRILSHSMSIIHSPHEPGDKALTSTDAKFVNWGLYLPHSKREIVRPDGTVDETMFFAHLVVNTELLLLHRPPSHLPYSPLETHSKCTPPTLSSSPKSHNIQQHLTMHTAKALEALAASITLFALPGDNVKHSPIATCALALAVMAQVSACRFYRGGARGKEAEDGRGEGREGREKRGAENWKMYMEGRDRVRLGLGALRAGVRVWGLARRSVGEVVGVARELLVGDGDCHGNEDRDGGGTVRCEQSMGVDITRSLSEIEGVEMGVR
ncbi:hypothetical protein BKA65DRAFT_550820 [Rhexocercosporidium sp. MPI-PUGE-AT-0058]|nr:hypothetical protein BKA65DRAFT_550820 [Rhexocercosporidium sp. MPI-PUGE-AT-0058]